ncbi:50S ribosomal protein L18 [Candidatus Woesebacteria bacterium]|nr:50S ribosomal protein L18 [Candidatus Woesebacteria bacterium]
MANKNLARKLRRKRRISSNIHGTAERPRISVSRSNVHISAQAVDDVAQKTLCSYKSALVAGREKKTKTEEAKEVGLGLAAELKAKKITHVVFDRGSFAYKGRVKAVAEAIREGGIVM